MKVVSIGEIKQSIEYLVEHTSRDDEVYYLTQQDRARAVMVSVEHYEALLRRVEQLEAKLAHIWAVIESETNDAPVDLSREAIMLPAPDGSWRPFRPTRPASPQVRAVIEQAAQLAWQRRDWTAERTMEVGRRAIERARQEAIARGVAIDSEGEVALDD